MGETEEGSFNSFLYWRESVEEEFIELFREQQAHRAEDPYYTPSHSSRPHLPIL